MQARNLVDNLVNNKPINHPTGVDWRELTCRITRMFGFSHDAVLDMKIRVLYGYWEWCVYFTQEDALSLQMRMM